MTEDKMLTLEYEHFIQLSCLLLSFLTSYLNFTDGLLGNLTLFGGEIGDFMLNLNL